MEENTVIKIYFEEKFSEEDKKIVKDHVDCLGKTHTLIYEDNELTSLKIEDIDIDYLWELLERIDCTFDVNIETSIEGFILTPKRPTYKLDSADFFKLKETQLRISECMEKGKTNIFI